MIASEQVGEADVYRQRHGIQVQPADTELVLLDEANRCVHQLNSTAAFIWRQFDGSASIRDIARRVAEQFDVDENIALRDAIAAIQQLRTLQLLQN
jgi:methyltransferase-like protein